MTTYAMSGNISTQNYGKEFEEKKVDGDLEIRIRIYPPKIAIKNDNATILLNIDKLGIPEFGDNDFMKVKWSMYSYEFRVNKDKYSASFTGLDLNPHQKTFYTRFTRSVSKQDIIRRTELEKMPGFRLTWFYDSKVIITANKNDWTLNKQFAR